MPSFLGRYEDRIKISYKKQRSLKQLPDPLRHRIHDIVICFGLIGVTGKTKGSKRQPGNL